MGCMSSVEWDENEGKQSDEATVRNFLTGGNIDNLWRQFDLNGDGHIDAAEFNNLVFVSLKFFCTERNPENDPPKQEEMQPFIDKLVRQLRPFVDKDNNMQISRDEFESYGEYLTNEFAKLQKELGGRK